MKEKPQISETKTSRKDVLGRVFITALLVGSTIFGAVEGVNSIVYNRPFPTLLHQILTGK